LSVGENTDRRQGYLPVGENTGWGQEGNSPVIERVEITGKS